MRQVDQSSRIVTRLMFRLLPIQILLALIGSVNAIVSSLFAGNFIGPRAMAAVGLYGPVAMLLGALSTMMAGGSQILCGKYMGRNLVEKMQNVFSLDMAVSTGISLLFTAFLLLISAFDLGGFLAGDPAGRPEFYQYALGQAAGVLPLILGSQLSAFLSLENQTRRVTVSSFACIVVNLLLNVLFVNVLHMETFGLSLAAALSMWVFFGIQALYFCSPKSTLRFSFRQIRWRESGEIVKVGLPGAVGYGYQTLRGIIVNNLLVAHVGMVGVSAFATANTLLSFFWTIPTGMLAVSRMLFSVSVGEEDRQTLADTMRTAMYRFVPLMAAISAALIALAVPLTHLYYRDPSDPVYEMTITGFRILPLCMPLSIICMHFTCFGQVSGKMILVHILSAMDGVVSVAAFSAILTPVVGVKGVYYANVINGVITTLIVLVYAVIGNRRFPRNTEELMVIPESFGVPDEDRMSVSIGSMEDVIRISQRIQYFCLDKGIDKRRAFLAGLCMEEMAGNVVTHGFTSDRRKHSADVRVVYRDGGLILRIKDNCVAFDPAARRDIIDPEDVTRNIGIRIVFDMAESVTYQSVLGLNVLTIRL